MLRKMNSNALNHFPKDLTLVILFTLVCIQTFSLKEKLYQKNYFLSTGSFFQTLGKLESLIKTLRRKKVLNDKPVLVDVRGMFDEEEAKRKEKDFITKRFSLFQMI